MPVTPTYPGVYIEEIPSGVRTITGVATSITAFIGRALQGPTDKAVRIQSFGDFERKFGGLWVESMMSYAVQQFFLNGGSDAIIIRVVSKTAKPATTTASGLNLVAASAGEWSSKTDQELQVTIDQNTRPNDPDETLFNLTIQQKIPNQATARPLEVFRNLSIKPNASRFVTKVLQEESNFVRIQGDIPQTRPGAGTGTFQSGSNGDAPPTYGDYWGNGETNPLLDKVDLFNLLCIPPNIRDLNVADDDAGISLLTKALAYCQERRAMLIVDPPTKWSAPDKAAEDSGGIRSLLRSKNAVVYFPQVRLADSLKENRLETFPPSGVMAGIMSRTDAQRGVWKAPAGTEAILSGVSELTYKLTDGENGQLNPLGINCLRSFAVYGNVAWGARTMEGADQLASEWKYLPVRRMALFLEESLYRGTQWVVFEPNDEPLWAQIRLNLGAFMNNLFRQGAFQGKTPREAYLVKCDKETTTQNDINLGIVNIVVGFAPLKPAEFVIIKLQQLAGQIEV
ncbi:MAG: phage tail sheath subtilisin-like domain-containing protein [Drouetiella hepatica Uher 2000/2452]|jgi:hypothetical protein|uniref:Phage tail sheath subtilisin-like domain-containing protein n=1 Tax=Drouetiella hepatica Uher 2000/2452 TaxID=904376 RepID=A0A951UMP2_9CYAN|nr:phage tail sheath subtilisin-like domain-containing protein [Drouetiella hepatica Uher 2000/2452]